MEGVQNPAKMIVCGSAGICCKHSENWSCLIKKNCISGSITGDVVILSICWPRVQSGPVGNMLQGSLLSDEHFRVPERNEIVLEAAAIVYHITSHQACLTAELLPQHAQKSHAYSPFYNLCKLDESFYGCGVTEST